jgi:hypothetical protein
MKKLIVSIVVVLLLTLMGYLLYTTYQAWQEAKRLDLVPEFVEKLYKTPSQEDRYYPDPIDYENVKG